MDIHDQNQTIESVYQNIDDGVEIQPQSFTTLSIDVERPNLPPRMPPVKPHNTRSTSTIEVTKSNP